MKLTTVQTYVLARMLRGDTLTTQTNRGRGWIRRTRGRGGPEERRVAYSTIDSLIRRGLIEIVDDRRMDGYTIHWYGLTEAGRREARK